MEVDYNLIPQSFTNKIQSFFELAQKKVLIIDQEFNSKKGSPVITENGKYKNVGWTEWTQGFQFGIPLLIFDATGDQIMLNNGISNTYSKMGHHLTHFGVHDHGFNNLSTYGNILRLHFLGKIEIPRNEKALLETAVKVSGAVQAKRWFSKKQSEGYIYSFNGPHSLFIDTIRSCRILVLSELLGHKMFDENDKIINLIERAIIHCKTTVKYAIFYGEGRDLYDQRGRVAHESIFNINDGNYRCPNSQQGYSGFSTWTRGLAWAILGLGEMLEFLSSYKKITDLISNETIELLMDAAEATADFYIENCSKDGIPYWDTSAPLLHKIPDHRLKNAIPINSFEPIDSSAAAIAAQGFLRLGRLFEKNDPLKSKKYFSTGLTITRTLLTDEYLANDLEHQGILKHSIYHHPNGWDYKPIQDKVPHGESSMWGDYHMVELCMLVKKISEENYYTFFEGYLD